MEGKVGFGRRTQRTAHVVVNSTYFKSGAIPSLKIPIPQPPYGAKPSPSIRPPPPPHPPRALSSSGFRSGLPAGRAVYSGGEGIKMRVGRGRRGPTQLAWAGGTNDFIAEGPSQKRGTRLDDMGLAGWLATCAREGQAKLVTLCACAAALWAVSHPWLGISSFFARESRTKKKTWLQRPQLGSEGRRRGGGREGGRSQDVRID
ncbi:hypothetical protein LY76DRAFT_157002 [Colletotrichum caudatum]|nr:hypothetical protein LY76DRAFT_157002 [Colletotrichum caudatum]